MNTNTTNTIAMLIDGDNAQARFIDRLLEETEKHGVVTIRRIYGDWTTPALGAWKKKLLQHSIKPVQKFALTRRKNSTDTAIIIDAMDLLHSKKVTGFCIVSADSDYTGLAQRIREDGLFVMGAGESNITSPAFVNACDKFVFTESLGSARPAMAAVKPVPVKPEQVKPPPEKVVAAVPTVQQEPDTLFEHIITEETIIETEVTRILRLKAPILRGLTVVGKIELPERRTSMR